MSSLVNGKSTISRETAGEAPPTRLSVEATPAICQRSLPLLASTAQPVPLRVET